MKHTKVVLVLAVLLAAGLGALLARLEALKKAGSVRLRPIMMTTATTVLGLLPMALGLGEGSELRSPMALTVIFALVGSMARSLTVMPVLASLVLILLPLWFLRRSAAPNAAGAQRWRVLVYFSALGLAFLFLEIAFIQKFVLFLHHPLYAVAVVLTAFLLFAGAGSLYSQRLVGTSGAVSVAVAAIAVASIVYLLALDRLLAPFASLADSLRILVSVVLIAPLAFFMGLPFPLGITRVGQRTPELIPWAWGINGCASVISAVLATLLAMHFGFTVVVVSAVLLYGVAAVSLPR